MNENNNENAVVRTLADLLSLLDQSDLTGTRRRDMISAAKRICEMFETVPASVPAQPPRLRELLSSYSPGCSRRHRQELLESEKPFRCRASASRRHRPARPGQCQTPPGMATTAGSHSR